MVTREIMNFVAGDSTGIVEFERWNPADPSDLVSVSAWSKPPDVADAVLAAVEAQPSWANTPPAARGTVLMNAADHLSGKHEEVARDLTREEGKTLAEARGEVRRAIDVLRYFGSAGWHVGGDVLPSGFPNTMAYTRREPLGTVGLITPWNFPIAIPAWKLAPALVSGNSVVLKPAELTPVSVQHLLDALTQGGLPAGVLNVVHGAGSVTGTALVGDSRVAAVSFTGSTAVGRQIRDQMEARAGRVQLEMGGKNALVVLDDADPARAASVAAVGGFGATGQACTASSRVICTPGIYDRFVDELAKKARDYSPGNGLHDGVLMGPVVSEEQLATDVGAIEQARTSGGEFAVGGTAPNGLLLDPTVITGLSHGHPVTTDEIFGPVITVLRANDLDEAIQVANDSKYGLAAGICTTSLASAQEFSNRVQAGVVKVNRPTTGLDLNVPFGGVKASSTNTFREQGSVAVDFYTWSKSVYLGWD